MNDRIILRAMNAIKATIIAVETLGYSSIKATAHMELGRCLQSIVNFCRDWIFFSSELEDARIDPVLI